MRRIPGHSWYGESVGHHEGGELVIDTIELNDKTFGGNYRTPHTEQIHVVERSKLIDGGKTLQALITLKDPCAFTTPRSAVQRWQSIHDGAPLPLSYRNYRVFRTAHDAMDTLISSPLPTVCWLRFPL